MTAVWPAGAFVEVTEKIPVHVVTSLQNTNISSGPKMEINNKRTWKGRGNSHRGWPSRRS